MVTIVDLTAIISAGTCLLLAVFAVIQLLYGETQKYQVLNKTF